MQQPAGCGLFKPSVKREEDMKLTRRSFVASTAATALIGLRPALAADEKVVRFGMPQDFTQDLYLRDRGI